MFSILISLLYGFFLGLAMSVDAFMLSLVYGLTVSRRREAFFIGLTIGLWHFMMPLLGFYFTSYILRNVFSLTLFRSQFQRLGAFILLLLGLFMLYKKEEVAVKKSTNLLSVILFGFTVSIDSFFIGIALSTNAKINMVLIALLFLGISSVMSYLAIRIIHHTKNERLTQNLNTLAGLILITFSCINLFLR